MSVRAKFRCDKKTLNDENQGEVLFRPVTSDSPENKSFFKFTPGGEIKLTVVSPSALGQFDEGKCYFVDFTDAEASAERGPGTPAAPHDGALARAEAKLEDEKAAHDQAKFDKAAHDQANFEKEKAAHEQAKFEEEKAGQHPHAKGPGHHAR